MNKFNEIIGYENIKKELERVLDYLNNKDKYEKFNMKKPDNILLFGDPGLGKTKMAKLFLEASNRNTYIISKIKANGSFDQYLEETVEEAVKNQPSIVLFDDLDKYSNDDIRHKNTDEYIIVQSLIDKYKDEDVFFIATTNNIEILPCSLLRPGRLGHKIVFMYPTKKDSIEIIKYYLSNKKVEKDVDYEYISKLLNCESCAVLEKVINEAALSAGFDNRELISYEDIIRAILRILYNAPICNEERTENQVKFAAYHEAGHAIVSELLEPNSVNLVSIDNYYGDIGGLTSVNISDDYWVDYTCMENRVLSLLAGKAALSIGLGKKDVGCICDLQRAERVVKRFYKGYCIDGFMDDEKRNKAVITKLNDYYLKVSNILNKNIKKLHEVSQYLINNYYLTGNELRNILKN